MIDLRSDTVTKPTAGMRRAMAEAPVGDDVYGEDPSINELEARTAELLGHEAGLFCPTGSMSNLLGIWLLVPRGQEVLCDQQAHIARAEMGAHAALHGITMRTWQSGRDGNPDGVASLGDVAGLLAPTSDPHFVGTAAIEIENTHNFGGGTIQPLDHLRELRQLTNQAGVAMHLDGARLWNAHVATGVPLIDFGRLFDTVSVCFSKGLGAPVGSVLVSSAANIERAREQRKRLGGGMRQAGILAAACSYALDHHVERLANDHAAAREFAEQVARQAPTAIDPASVQTNIVRLDTGVRSADEVARAAARQQVALSVVGPHVVRAVTHLDVTRDECRSAGQLVGALLAG